MAKLRQNTDKDKMEFKENYFTFKKDWYTGYYIVDIDVKKSELWFPDTFDGMCINKIDLPINKVYPDVKIIYIPEKVHVLNLVSSNFPQLEKVVCIEGPQSCYTTDGKMIFEGKDSTLHVCLVDDGDSITVPASVKTIHSKAFYGTSYSEINFPYNDFDIAYDAFDNSKWFKLQKENADYIVIGSVLISAKCENKVLKIPDKVKKIHPDFFKYCKPEKIVCGFMLSGNNVRCFDRGKFCKSYYINSPSAAIDIKRLKNMNFLEEVIIAENHPLYRTKNGVVYSADGKTLIWYPSSKKNKEFIIPDHVKKIDKFAFAKQKYLEKVIIPDNVQIIGVSSFYQCKTLKEVYISEGIKEIPNACAYQYGGVFEGCSHLSYVKLPNSLRYIGSFAFYKSQLSGIKFGNSLEQIGEYSFAFTHLSDIKLPASLKYLNKGSLLNINHVTAYEGTARGLVSAINAVQPSMKETNANVFWNHCEISVLDENGNKKSVFLIPKSLVGTLICCLDSAWNADRIDYDEYDECFTGIKDADEKLEFAETRLLDIGDDANSPFASYLKRVSGKIAHRLLENKKENEFLSFLKRGFLSNAALQKLLEYSNKQGLVVCSAYIVELLEKNGYKKKQSTFRL